MEDRHHVWSGEGMPSDWPDGSSATEECCLSIEEDQCVNIQPRSSDESNHREQVSEVSVVLPCEYRDVDDSCSLRMESNRSVKQETRSVASYGGEEKKLLAAMVFEEGELELTGSLVMEVTEDLQYSDADTAPNREERALYLEEEKGDETDEGTAQQRGAAG